MITSLKKLKNMLHGTDGSIKLYLYVVSSLAHTKGVVMPNWCENNLTVVGPEEKLTAFVAHVADGKEAISFNKTVPEPFEKSEYLTDSQHDWRLENWGAKWDVHDVDVVENPGCYDYSFMTAWTPPIPWLERMAKEWPDLEFYLKYDEPGMEIHGVWCRAMIR